MRLPSPAGATMRPLAGPLSHGNLQTPLGSANAHDTAATPPRGRMVKPSTRPRRPPGAQRRKRLQQGHSGRAPPVFRQSAPRRRLRTSAERISDEKPRSPGPAANQTARMTRSRSC